MRKYSKMEFGMKAEMEDFSIDEADCYEERDRALVKANIVRFMTQNGNVECNAQPEDILSAFDILVRRTVTRAFGESIGPRFRYSLMMVSLFPDLCAALEDAAVSVHFGRPLRIVLPRLINRCSINLAIVPIFLAGLRAIFRWKAALQGLMEFVFWVTIGVLSFAAINFLLLL